MTTPKAQAATPSTKPDAAPAVRADGVSFVYGTRRALDNLSLEIRVGELFAVLGPNGGGKTTLFRLLSTLVPPQAGSLAVFGHDLAREASAVRRMASRRRKE